MTCSTCRFADPTIQDADLLLTCHRYPPVIVAVNGGPDEAGQAWPNVDSTDWCGEHQVKDSEP